MATIVKRGDRWQCKIRRSGVNLSKTFLLKRDAERWGRETEASIDRLAFRDYSAAEFLTISGACDLYRVQVLPRKRSKSQTASDLKVLVRDLGNLPLVSFSGVDIGRFVDSQEELEMSGDTIRKRVGLLFRVLAHCISSGIHLPHGNPCRDCKLPPLGISRDRRLMGDEWERFSSALSLTDCWSVVIVALETAMRRSELANLVLRDVDFKESVIYIRKSKTGIPRIIPMSGVCCEVLERLDDGQGNTALSHSVFNLKSDSITQAFTRACERAGISNLRFHDLRHEAISRLFEKGLSIVEVMAISGHRTPQMLARYTHLRAIDLVPSLPKTTHLQVGFG